MAGWACATLWAVVASSAAGRPALLSTTIPGAALLALLARPDDAPASTGRCSADGSGGPWCEAFRCDFSTVLSAPADFPASAGLRALPGMHAVCLWRNDVGGVEGYAHMGVTSGAPVRRFNLPSASMANLPALRKALAKSLGVKKKTNNWGHLKFKQEYGLFTLDGERLESLDSVLEALQVLLIEGGQWVWPPVRSGHVWRVGGVQLETLSMQPIVFGVKSFLRKDECKELIKHAGGRMAASGVMRRDSNSYRTSNDTRLESWEFEMLPSIDERVANVTRMPKVYHEELQVAHFDPEQYYAYHADAYDPTLHKKEFVKYLDHGHRNRFATMIFYLSKVKIGGETMFPRSFGLPEPEKLHVCDGGEGLKVKPEVGNAVLFYNLLPNGNFDNLARHAGCPPLSQDGKWSANKWIWNKPTPQRNSRKA